MVQGKINRGRHTDHPAGRHSIQTKQCPPPPSLHFFTGHMPFLPPKQQCQSTEGAMVKTNSTSGLTYVSIQDFCQKQQVITSPRTLLWWQVWWRSVEDCELCSIQLVLCDRLTDCLTHSHTQTDFIIWPMLLMHGADNEIPENYILRIQKLKKLRENLHIP